MYDIFDNGLHDDFVNLTMLKSVEMAYLFYNNIMQTIYTVATSYTSALD